jgi:ATP-dependent Lon protease
MNHDIDSILPKYIMVKNNPLNRMPKKAKQPLPGNGGKDSDDESDSSVDSHGNLRDLIEYGSDSEEPSPRPIRKAALLARKKIDLIMKKSRKADKEDRLQNTVHYPTVKRRPHIPSSPSIYSPSNSANEEMEETIDDEETEDEIDIEETDEEPEMEETDQDTESNEDEQNEELFRYILKMGDHGGENKSMVPKKYNMKLEPESVQRFVTLLTTPMEENTIDTQIGQFKEMTEEKQNELLHALENRPTVNNSGINLMLRILTMKLPQEVQATILAKYNSLQSLDQSSNEYFKLRAWLDKVVSIPFGTYKDIPVRLDDGSEKCGEFMRNSKKCLDESVYGQEESKLQIMQFISSKIANPNSRGLCLLLTGPPGIGKTTIIKNGIAKALGWPFQFISLGGDSDASTYTGHQLVYESSHCGKIVNSLIASKSMSTVLMFDEVDKISQTPKGEEIMNLLIHLTDPVQNSEFEDKYLAGIPIDLSKVMFVFSANDITKIDRVLLDRMVVITLKGYDLKQKTVIAEQYLLPDALNEVNLTEKVAISKEILTKVIEDYANEEKGVRELKRCIEQITQKINMLRMYNSPDLPFYIKDFALPFIVKKDHVPLFLKKKEAADLPPYGMYT